MDSAGTEAVFHEGEQQMQSSVAAQARLAALGSQLIRDHMPEQHRLFFNQLPFVVVGGVDRQGQPWASLLCNPPGFITSPNPHQLTIAALPTVLDPLSQILTVGAAIAVLGIEQHTRRRNRMNGRVIAISSSSIEVAVDQSFGNCPKYIQTRQAEYWPRSGKMESTEGSVLNARMAQIISNADTFFITSAHPHAHQQQTAAQGVDVSHRGGKPGFVRIEGEGRLLVPDLSGNRFFNTIGNLLLNPCAGLLFIDFNSGDLLYLATEVTIIDQGAMVESFIGAERMMAFKINKIIQITAAAPLRWQGAVELSPFLQGVGEWPVE